VNARVQLAVAIPQTFLTGAVDRDLIRAFLARAEQLGVHSAWVVEQIVGKIPSLEPVTLLTYAAAVTERIGLGSAVLLTALRSPVQLAKSLASLDQLSGGRLIVGVGLGGNPKISPAFGFPVGRRAARFAEGIGVMRRLWTEQRVTSAGEFYTLDNAAMEPKPLQKPHPPIWFGAHHPDALKRAAALGDGFMGAGSISTEQFAQEVTHLRRFLGEAGRDPDRFPIGKRVYLAIDRDRDRAVRRLAEWFRAFYGRPELAGQVAVCGDVGECLEGLGRVVQAGAGLLMLNPVFDEMEHLERFASELSPKL
jgi:probable F420-dependent oxidoreductase